MSITKKNISTKNLNLLVVFSTLFETQSVSETAKRLGMSQPNVSRALRLLRLEFSDPLFVRVPRGIVATKRATELALAVDGAMESIQNIYVAHEFDPKTTVRRFTIYTTDYIEILLAPQLASWVSQEAPGVTLNFRSSHGNLPRELMEKGECDLCVLVVREDIPPGYFKQDLFLDPYLSAVRKRHPILKNPATLEKFLEFGHVLLNPQGTMWSIIDERLLKMKKKRQLVIGSPNANSCVFTIAKSDLILSATARFLNAAAEFLPIETFKNPFNIEPIQVAQVWHERAHTDPLNQWIRKKIKSLLV